MAEKEQPLAAAKAAAQEKPVDVPKPGKAKPITDEQVAMLSLFLG